jgi:hypothetical protein
MRVGIVSKGYYGVTHMCNRTTTFILSSVIAVAMVATVPAFAKGGGGGHGGGRAGGGGSYGTTAAPRNTSGGPQYAKGYGPGMKGNGSGLGYGYGRGRGYGGYDPGYDSYGANAWGAGPSWGNGGAGGGASPRSGYSGYATPASAVVQNYAWPDEKQPTAEPARVPVSLKGYAPLTPVSSTASSKSGGSSETQNLDSLIRATSR